MSEAISGKKILVTGGTGSFGQMFVDEILKLGPSEVIIFSRDEDKQGEMRLSHKNNKKLRFVLGDIRDYRSVRQVMRGVDVVIHAAALKWITEVEYNVWEGIKTNVVGAQNIIEAAKDENVEKVVALSTDKAVEPVNAYGMAKALQERLITTANLYDDKTRTVFVSTRYGNVLGSRGSVVPLFKSLIEKGKPLTVTDPNMTRFIMTLSESVDLVLRALEDGVGGEVFVRKAPAHTISDLVDVMGNNLSKDKVNVENIGIRPGEKLHETLIGAYESSRTVQKDNYFVVLPQIEIEKVVEKYKSFDRKSAKNSYSSDNTDRLSKIDLEKILKKEKWI
ncbi:SDR family NAD(P)-dependent oxidoreductase [Candidatus Microgenomates bacterium]|nr:SDR family NAD(P)-dependent oxidoreductase [Candidatus Microgenomates bacterium]